MWPISDSDIDEMWKLINSSNILADYEKIKFIEGFQRGWKRKALEIVQLRKEYVKYLEEGLEKNPNNFGFFIGILIGPLRMPLKEFLSVYIPYLELVQAFKYS
ncbi:MAG: hypothetical protein AABX78_01630, partial [Nanoarchaeota archaeon]